MLKAILYINALLTLPFGIAALVAPAAVFAGFGITLDAGSSLIARGYAATCIGYGAVYLLARKTQQAEARTLLVGSLLFNGIEFAIQLMAALQATASPAIWGTVGAHGVMTLLSAIALKSAR